MKYLLLLASILTVLIVPNAVKAEPPPIKIGVSTALTGDAATFGTDIKNALLFANEKFAHNRYQFVFEDDHCTGKDAVAVAHKFISIDNLNYVLGFACNQALLAAAPIYQSAGIIVLTSSAETGDILDVGDKIFRLFPAEQAGAELLYDYISNRYSKIGVLTEQNEFSELLRRGFFARNKTRSPPLDITAEEFRTDDSDLRAQLLRFKSAGVEALYINTNAEPTFIRVVQQMGRMGFHPKMFASYWPDSPVVMKEVGASLEGIVFSNLPEPKDLLSELGDKTLSEYRKKYGDSASGASVVPITIEALRIFDAAMSSGSAVDQYFRHTEFDGGLIGKYRFDEHGAVSGIKFILQTVRDGKVIKLVE